MTRPTTHTHVTRPTFTTSPLAPGTSDAASCAPIRRAESGFHDGRCSAASLASMPVGGRERGGLDPSAATGAALWKTFEFRAIGVVSLFNSTASRITHGEPVPCRAHQRRRTPCAAQPCCPEAAAARGWAARSMPAATSATRAQTVIRPCGSASASETAPAPGSASCSRQTVPRQCPVCRLDMIVSRGGNSDNGSGFTQCSA